VIKIDTVLRQMGTVINFYDATVTPLGDFRSKDELVMTKIILIVHKNYLLVFA
jgi:hypothetical protein